MLVVLCHLNIFRQLVNAYKQKPEPLVDPFLFLSFQRPKDDIL